MAESNYRPSAKPAVEIVIVGLNKDLTRKPEKADGRYEVYFDLSGIPFPDWITILLREWKRLNREEPRLWNRIAIKDRHLVMYTSPQEIAQKHLPVLQLAIVAANKAHRRSITKPVRKTQVW